MTRRRLQGQSSAQEKGGCMHLASDSLKWIMLVAGALTCTMAYVALAPHAALLLLFGETFEGPLAEIFVRNWGALITLQGALLVWGAFNPQTRSLALVFADACKLVFIALVLSFGGHYLGRQAGITVAIAFDLVCVVLF